MNVHDDGNVLEIVGMCSSHGTHVASIAAGNHKSTGFEELNGVAPGAKIVSLTIGDGRLGSVVFQNFSAVFFLFQVSKTLFVSFAMFFVY